MWSLSTVPIDILHLIVLQVPGHKLPYIPWDRRSRQVYHLVDVHSERVIQKSRRSKDGFYRFDFELSILYRGIRAAISPISVMFYMLRNDMLSNDCYVSKCPMTVLLHDSSIDMHPGEFETFWHSIMDCLKSLDVKVDTNCNLFPDWILLLLQNPRTTESLASDIQNYLSHQTSSWTIDERQSFGKGLMRRQLFHHLNTTSTWLKVLMEVFKLCGDDLDADLITYLDLPEWARIISDDQVLDMYRTYQQRIFKSAYVGSFESYLYLMTKINSLADLPVKILTTSPYVFDQFAHFDEPYRIVIDWVKRGYGITDISAMYFLDELGYNVDIFRYKLDIPGFVADYLVRLAYDEINSKEMEMS